MATPAPTEEYRVQETVEVIVGFYLRDRRFFGCRSGPITVRMWPKDESEEKDNSAKRFILGDSAGVPHLYQTQLGHYVSCVAEAFGQDNYAKPDEQPAGGRGVTAQTSDGGNDGRIMSRAMRCSHVMKEWVMDGQCVDHGLPIAIRFLEPETQEWSKFFGNEIFVCGLDDNDEWKQLPTPPPLVRQGMENPPPGAVFPDPYGRLMCADA